MVRLVLALAVILTGGAASPLPSTAPSPAPSASAAASPGPAASGPEASAHWATAAADPATQALIDRAVAMLFAFNEGEARVDFEAAAKREPDLALAYWGEAETDAIDINVPTTPAGETRGADAAAAGRRHLKAASEEERALVDAIAGRFGRGSLEQKYKRYADALSAYTAKHQDDANVLVIAGFAIYTGYDLLDKAGAPTAKGRESLADADRALQLDPENLGAHHLRIHLLEGFSRAKDAVSDADALDGYRYAPGESHLAHMAGHIWTRLGEYQKLIDDNERAVANDNAYFASGTGPGREYMQMYHDHDLDFVAYGLTTLGRSDDARKAVEHEDAPMRLKVALRLHDDAAALAIEPGGAGIIAYYHAIAAAREGDLARAHADEKRIGDMASLKTSPVLAAALAAGAHDTAAEERIFAKAFGEEPKTQGELGDPKSRWATPIGEGYGALLLRVGKFAEAEHVFAVELGRYPNDPHLEFGIAEAQRLQHEDDGVMRALYRAHWQGAHDLTLADLG